MRALTYAPVGGTLSGAPTPKGYATLRHRARVGPPEAFGAAVEVVLAFGMQRGVGFGVDAATVVEGADVLLTVGRGRLALRAPVRVVAVVEEADRRGFAYGTLEGHPESGEEAFLVERDAEGTWAEVRAFSRPGRWYTRAAGPAGHLLQRTVARGYVRAVRRSLRRAGSAW